MSNLFLTWSINYCFSCKHINFTKLSSQSVSNLYPPFSLISLYSTFHYISPLITYCILLFILFTLYLFTLLFTIFPAPIFLFAQLQKDSKTPDTPSTPQTSQKAVFHFCLTWANLFPICITADHFITEC